MPAPPRSHRPQAPKNAGRMTRPPDPARLSAAVSPLFDLSGKSAVVTGSTKGIGKAIARALARHGARVIVSSRDEGRVEAAARELADEGLKALGLTCNVGRKEDLERLIEESRRALGPIDIVVGNAAINPHYGSFADISDDAFAKIMATNVQSNLWLAQLVADDMRERRDGAIIYVSSIGGTIGSDVIGAYCISKAAEFQLVRNLAVELGPHNIRVNAIAPGLVKTDFARALWEDERSAAARIARTPLRRLGRARGHRRDRGLSRLGRGPLDHRPELRRGRRHVDRGIGAARSLLAKRGHDLVAIGDKALPQHGDMACARSRSTRPRSRAPSATQPRAWPAYATGPRSSRASSASTVPPGCMAAMETKPLA